MTTFNFSQNNRVPTKIHFREAFFEVHLMNCIIFKKYDSNIICVCNSTATRNENNNFGARKSVQMTSSGFLHEIRVPSSNIIFDAYTCFYLHTPGSQSPVQVGWCYIPAENQHIKQKHQRGQKSGIVHPVTHIMSHLAWLWSTVASWWTKITRSMKSF